MQRYPKGSGTFRIGNDIAVNRLGFSAMRLTDEGIWGEPADRAECLRVLRRLPELGVTFIDTAHSYGPNVSEHLIRVALHPYGGRLRGQGGHDHDAGRCRQPAGPGIAGRLGVMKDRGLTPIPLLDEEQKPIGIIYARDALPRLLGEAESDEALLRDHVMDVGYKWRGWQ